MTLSKRLRRLTIPLALGITAPMLAADGPITAQAARGKALFLKSEKGTACGTCHSVKDIGTPVGPDLTRLGSLLMPRGMVMAIKMTMTETVQEVKIEGMKEFPGRVQSKEGDVVKVWDLSVKPPELRTYDAKQVEKIKRDDQQKWKHPPTSVDYEAAELADIIGFIRWASTGNEKEVTVEEVE